MSDYRYRLDNSSRKHPCPECEKRRFVRYIDNETGDQLPDEYGSCDREGKCAHHLSPYADGYAQMIRAQEQGEYAPRSSRTARRPPPRPKPVQKPSLFHIPAEVLKQTLQGYEHNIFLQNLLCRVPFPLVAEDVERVVALYYLGTVRRGYRAGATTFPFRDIDGNFRAVQVKQFDQENHTTGTDFLHSIIEKHHTRRNEPLPAWLEAYNQNDSRVSCLFGEHLLSKYPDNPVALVEAPKTAVYGTLYFGFPHHPDRLIWLGVYNKSSFTLDKLRALQGRDVYTFADLSAEGGTFKEWRSKAAAIERQLPGIRFVFSDLLERLAPESDKQKGSDLADYLIKLDWRKFREDARPSATSLASETPICEKCEKCEGPNKPFFSCESRTHHYDPAAIAGLIASPHHFTSIEAVNEIADKVPEPFWYDALLDYNTAMQTPAPEEAARAYLRVFHKLRS